MALCLLGASSDGREGMPPIRIRWLPYNVHGRGPLRPSLGCSTRTSRLIASPAQHPTVVQRVSPTPTDRKNVIRLSRVHEQATLIVQLDMTVRTMGNPRGPRRVQYTYAPALVLARPSPRGSHCPPPPGNAKWPPVSAPVTTDSSVHRDSPRIEELKPHCAPWPIQRCRSADRASARPNIPPAEDAPSNTTSAQSHPE